MADATAEPIVFHGNQGADLNIAFSLDGSRIITTGNTATVTLWKTDGTSEPLNLDGFRASVQSVASLDANRYVIAHDDGTIRIWHCFACGPITEILTTAGQHLTWQLNPGERQVYLATNP